MSFVKGLQCRECGKEYPARLQAGCEDCFAPLEVNYDYAAAGNSLTQESIASRPANLWRYRELLPLEVEPVVGPDGVTIDLNLVPQVVEFEGFINYGSPIQTFSTNALGITTTQVLTPNVINQPIFNSRKVTTSVSVWDGQTVVLGGLMREDVQKTEDRTPIIGDIPLVGRLFRSNSEQHIKRNLVIFVTARLVDPAGQPINGTEEEEETETASQIEPPVLPQVPYYKK